MQANNRFILSAGTEFGKYTVISELGHGGMGAVYRVKHRMLNSYFALKVLYSDKAGKDSTFVERFIREAQLASQIKHPNLVAVYDVGHDPQFNVYFIVMEYISGGSLRDYLKANKMVSELNALKIIYQTVSALQTASQWKMVHRDIKPDNIMFDSNGDAKLADLGIAKVPDEQVNSTSKQLIGTPAYMSPEQIRDSSHVDERSDIYSLGIVLLEMLSGNNPQHKSTMMETLSEAVSRKNFEPEIALLKKNGISERTLNLIRVMTAADPGNRPRSHQILLTLVRNAAVALSNATQSFTVNARTGRKPAAAAAQKNPESRSRAVQKIIPLLRTVGVLMVILGVVYGIYRFNKTKVDQWVIMQVKRYSLELHTEPHAQIRLVNEDSHKTYSLTGNRSGVARMESCPPGKYTVSVSCNYFHPIPEFGFTLSKNEKITLPQMKRRKMDIQIIGAKPGSSVTVSSEALSRNLTFESAAEMIQQQLDAGYSYTVRVNHPFYFPFEATVFLNSSRTVEIAQVLQKGDLFLSDPSGVFSAADLSLVRIIDGHQEKIVSAGKGKFFAGELTPTDYQLTVSKPYFEPVTRTITISEEKKNEKLPVLTRKKGFISILCSRKAHVCIYRILPDGGKTVVKDQILDRLQTQFELKQGIPYLLEADMGRFRRNFKTNILLKDETFKEITIDKGF